ncbi:hypothetical protein REPUB_Repub10bG0162000 [Reevesia pubescens]
MIFIKEDLKISDVQVEVLAGILNLCALAGSLLAGRTSDHIGRRYTISLASIIFLFIQHSAEISSPSTRCFLTSLPELCISFGILLGYTSNYFFGKLTLKLSWRMMLGIAAIPIPFTCLSFWHIENARDIKIAGGIDANCIEDAVKPPKIHHGQGVWKELLIRPTPTVRRILIMAIGIRLFENATEIEAVVLYSPRIFKKAGVISKSKQKLATVGVGLGPITWEIYPLKLRAQGASIGVTINNLMNATVSMSFISIYKAITIGGSFFTFAGVAVVA